MKSRNLGRPVPAARSERLLIEPVGDETVVYDLDTKEAHCLKPAAAFVFMHADGNKSLGEIIDLARHRFGNAVADQDIEAAVRQLEGVSLLERPLIVLDAGISRRQMVRKVAYTGAAATMATTLITTIGAPTALAVACSGQPSGCACGKNKECISNHCCGDVGNSGKCNAGCCADNNGNLCQCSGTPLACASPPTPTSGCCTGVCTPVNSPC